MNTDGHRKIFVAVAFWVILSVAVLAIAIIELNRVDDNTVKITNLDRCSTNIHKDIRKAIFDAVFFYVAAANDHNGRETSRYYRAEIRDGSCQQTVQNDEVYNTTAIVDIPEAEQSWRIQYFWITNSVIWVDLGDITLSCLSADELIFGDFDCRNIPFAGRNTVDPILSFLPYSQINYDVRFGGFTPEDITELNVMMFIYWFDLLNSTKEAAIEKYKAEINEWIKSHDLDPNDYMITIHLHSQEPDY